MSSNNRPWYKWKENRIWIEEEQDGEHTFNAEVTMS